jgi:hypothetical protein
MTIRMDRLMMLFIFGSYKKTALLGAAFDLFPFRGSGELTRLAHQLPAQALIGSRGEPKSK